MTKGTAGFAPNPATSAHKKPQFCNFWVMALAPHVAVRPWHLPAAAAMAGPGGTGLLAPGCASWDMFRDYAQRGDMFAESVRSLVQEDT